jgi:hypothetical protein
MASTTEPTTRELPDALPPAEPPRRAPRRPRGPGGRRLQPAGYAVLTILIASAVAVLLNAQGLRKTAQTEPEGLGRDIGLALTKPLTAVSHALLLDRPRQGLKDALGRGDDDTIDTTIALPPPVTGSAQTETAPATTGAAGETGPAVTTEAATGNQETVAPKPAFSPKKKLKLWVAGDSLAITPGQSILRILPATKVIKPVAPVDGRVATGLERPDVFNWFTHVPEELRRLDPRVVVLAFGANDDHDYMTGVPEGVELDGFGSSSWVREYRRRVGGIMDLATRGDRFLVWIGIPITRGEEQSKRFAVINRIYESEAKKRAGRVVFVDTYDLFTDENGDYADYLPNKKGEIVHVRAPDGVHFETEGGDWIARAVLAELKQVYDLTSWKKKRRG